MGQRDTQVGKLFFDREDADNEWRLAEDIRDNVDPANAFTPNVSRLCKVVDVPRDVRSGCEHSRHILDREPYQLVMADAGVAWSKAGSLPVTTWLGMLDTVLTGLVALHDSQAVHLDIKPDNLLFQASTRRAFLIDFSLVTPIAEVFDAPYLRENGDYEVWPPEFAMLHDIRQQQYEVLYVHGQGGRAPATYADKMQTIHGGDAPVLRQTLLDDLDGHSMARLDVDRVVRAGVRRFVRGFPTTGAWGSRMANDVLTADVNRWRDEQANHGVSAKTTILQDTNTFDSYGVAYTLDVLLERGRILFDAATTDEQFRVAVFRPAREPSAHDRATVGQLLQAVRDLLAARPPPPPLGGALDLAARAAAQAIAARDAEDRRLAAEAAAVAEAARAAQAQLAAQVVARALAAGPAVGAAPRPPVPGGGPRRRPSAARPAVAVAAVPPRRQFIDLTGPSPPPPPRAPAGPAVINLWSP